MNEIPLIDQNQMDRLNEWGGKDLQRKMIELFLTHANERLSQIKEGASGGNSDMAETGAHTLKSSAGNVGAQRVQRLAQDAEGLAEAGQFEELMSLLPSLEEEFQAACGVLEGLLKEVGE